MKMLSFLPRHIRRRRVEKALSPARPVVLLTWRAHGDGVLVDSYSLAFRDTLRTARSMLACYMFALAIQLPAALNGVSQM
jgi:uncharacterized membrane protein YccC